MQTGGAEGRGNVCVPGGSQCLLRRLYSPFLPLAQQCCMAVTNGYGCVMTSLLVPKAINVVGIMWPTFNLQKALTMNDPCGC